MTPEEIRDKRQYVGEIGHNAGQCVGNMCNTLLSDSLSKEDKQQRLKQSYSVACREMKELETIAIELMNQPL